MDRYFTIPFRNTSLGWLPLRYEPVSSFCLEGTCILHCWVVHSHKYGFSGFFYKSKRIYDTRYFRSKTALFDFIEALLQEELYVDVQ